MSDLPEFVADKGPFASFGALLTLLIYRFWPSPNVNDALADISRQVADAKSEIAASISDLRTQVEVARQTSAGNEKLIEHRLGKLEVQYGEMRSSISGLRREIAEK